MSKGQKRAIDSLSVVLASDSTTPAIAASENFIGQTGTPATVVTITPVVLNADAYDAGDVLFDVIAIADACRTSGGVTELNSIVVIDTDDQKAAMTLVFMGASQSLGTKDSAPDIDDTEVLDVIGTIDIAAGDYKDLGGASVATLRNLGLLLKPTTGTSIYVAGYTGGTPTHTTGGLRIKFGFVQA